MKLVLMPRIQGETLELLAQRANEKCGEIIATNEQKMLEFPRVIEKLYLNKRVRMSTADRLIELAVRNRIELGFSGFREAAEAIQQELIPEPTEEPTFDDLLFKETEKIARAIAADDEDTHEPDEEGEEQLKDKFLPLYAQIAQMNVTQKIRRALMGPRPSACCWCAIPTAWWPKRRSRAPYCTSTTPLASPPAAPSCRTSCASSRMNKEFTRSYQVKLNLVTNPRTPQTFSLAAWSAPARRRSAQPREEQERAFGDIKPPSASTCFASRAARASSPNPSKRWEFRRPRWGAGVEIPRLSTDMIRVLRSFLASIPRNRGTTGGRGGARRQPRHPKPPPWCRAGAPPGSSARARDLWLR